MNEALAQLKETISSGLSGESEQEFLNRFSNSAKSKNNLSLLAPKFLHWILTDQGINPGISDSYVHDIVERCADLILSISEDGVHQEKALVYINKIIETAGKIETSAMSKEADARMCAEDGTRSPEDSINVVKWSLRANTAACVRCVANSIIYSARSIMTSPKLTSWGESKNAAEYAVRSAEYADKFVKDKNWSAAIGAAESMIESAASAEYGEKAAKYVGRTVYYVVNGFAWKAVDTIGRAAQKRDHAYRIMSDKLIQLVEAA